MSFLSPGFTLRRAFNGLLGDLGSLGCLAGPVWTTRGSPGINASRQLEVGNGVALAFGGAGDSITIGRATDVLWSNVTPDTGIAHDWSCAAFGAAVGGAPGRWVLLPGLRTANAAYWTSDDGGLTWTLRAMPVAATWNVVAFANGTFIAIEGGITSSTVAYTSPDGIAWTSAPMDHAATWSGLAFNPNSTTWIAIAADATASKSTNNGATWTAVTTLPVGGAGPTASQRLTFAQTTIGLPTNAFITSTSSGTTNAYISVDDGVTWLTTGASSGVGSQIGRAIFAQGVIIMPIANVPYIYVGTDRTHFRDATNPPQNQLPGTSGFPQIGYLGNGKYMAVQSGGAAASGVC